MAELPVWARRRRRDLTTALDVARRDEDVVDAHLARAEATVATASATVDADAAEQTAATNAGIAERHSRWQRRSGQAYRNPNLVTDRSDPATAAVREPANVAAGRDVDRSSDLLRPRPGRRMPGHAAPER